MLPILFDLDNTLTDRRESITEFAARFAEAFHITMPFAELNALLQSGDQLGYKAKSKMFAELAAVFPFLTIETISRFWYEVSPQCMVVRRGVHDLLTELEAAGFFLGIITNGRIEQQNNTLDSINVRSYMDVILISEAVGFQKPDPKIFQMALEALDAETAWFVGDHPINDVIGADNAGLFGVWLQSGGHPWPADYAFPSWSIDSLTELYEILAEG